MQCLETAFGITLSDTSLKSPKSLREMFRNGASARPSAAEFFPDLNAFARGQAENVNASTRPAPQVKEQPLSYFIRLGYSNNNLIII